MTGVQAWIRALLRTGLITLPDSTNYHGDPALYQTFVREKILPSFLRAAIREMTTVLVEEEIAARHRQDYPLWLAPDPDEVVTRRYSRVIQSSYTPPAWTDNADVLAESNEMDGTGHQAEHESSGSRRASREAEFAPWLTPRYDCRSLGTLLRRIRLLRPTERRPFFVDLSTLYPKHSDLRKLTIALLREFHAMCYDRQRLVTKIASYGLSVMGELEGAIGLYVPSFSPSSSSSPLSSSPPPSPSAVPERTPGNTSPAV